MSLKIFFGSQSGNAQNLARVIGESLTSSGIENEVFNMAEVDPENLQALSKIVIVVSTYGDGEAPDTASEWMSYLKFDETISLSNLQYAVIGLGDTYYPHFCQCGKDFDHYLSKRGAHAMLKRLDCDLYYEEQYQDWVDELIKVLNHSHQS